MPRPRRTRLAALAADRKISSMFRSRRGSVIDRRIVGKLLDELQSVVSAQTDTVERHWRRRFESSNAIIHRLITNARIARELRLIEHSAAVDSLIRETQGAFVAVDDDDDDDEPDE